MVAAAAPKAISGKSRQNECTTIGNGYELGGRTNILEEGLRQSIQIGHIGHRRRSAGIGPEAGPSLPRKVARRPQRQSRCGQRSRARTPRDRKRGRGRVRFAAADETDPRCAGHHQQWIERVDIVGGRAESMQAGKYYLARLVSHILLNCYSQHYIVSFTASMAPNRTHIASKTTRRFCLSIR